MYKLSYVAIAAFLAVAPATAKADQTPIAGHTVLGVQVNVESVVTTGYSANRLIGATVFNSDKKEVGRIHDLIVSTDGQVNLAIVEVGGFIGIGSKYVAIPARLFKEGVKQSVLLPGASEAELKKMPPFQYAG
ncbi:MAG: PRC-barrel domain-containing protein [Pseudomonadota bacterium]